MSLAEALTLFAVLVALFGAQLWKWLSQPVLTVMHPDSPPEFVKTKLTGGKSPMDCHFLRFLVHNKNVPLKPKAQARDVEVFLAEVRHVKDNGETEKVERFLPMNLTWSHTLAIGRQMQTTPWDRTHLRLSPGMRRHCDLGFIVKPEERLRPSEELALAYGFKEEQTILHLQVEKPPSTGGHLIGPGEYEFDILVGAANRRKPVSKTYRLALSGEWHPDPAEMYGKGISIEPV